MQSRGGRRGPRRDCRVHAARSAGDRRSRVEAGARQVRPLPAESPDGPRHRRRAARRGVRAGGGGTVGRRSNLRRAISKSAVACGQTAKRHVEAPRDVRRRTQGRTSGGEGESRAALASRRPWLRRSNHPRTPSGDPRRKREFSSRPPARNKPDAIARKQDLPATAVISAVIDRPTTRRENRPITAATSNQPSAVQMSVKSATRFLFRHRPRPPGPRGRNRGRTSAHGVG